MDIFMAPESAQVMNAKREQSACCTHPRSRRKGVHLTYLATAFADPYGGAPISGLRSCVASHSPFLLSSFRDLELHGRGVLYFSTEAPRLQSGGL